MRSINELMSLPTPSKASRTSTGKKKEAPAPPKKVVKSPAKKTKAIRKGRK